ncbi:hypothetical protein CUMW_147210 [Citrus unshiu]|nr:hypothetical protein CUMW_147210 [Citrus unshiu]
MASSGFLLRRALNCDNFSGVGTPQLRSDVVEANIFQPSGEDNFKWFEFQLVSFVVAKCE